MPKPNSEDTEVVASAANDRKRRRTFSAEEKVRILREADACTERGQLGELLRREGVYGSHLTAWRAQLAQSGRDGLEPKRRGPKPTKDAKDKLLAQQEKRIAKLEKELRISKALLEMQGKAREILALAQAGIDEETEGGSQNSSKSAHRESR